MNIFVLYHSHSFLRPNHIMTSKMYNRVTIVIKLLMTVGTNLHVMSINLAQVVNILSEDLGFKNGS